ncbi:hypothetical protein N136_04680 [Leifsonia aquatica ATCC 14665]|uniref:Uncharacterized protein n=1 Tax=Leifsonia aquatica ATCC 14665 TaxID=1358026 RepID=U2RF96_LEIAQ|nr:hypothetical protein N136_04680 [Leifsonia aquatica ATCC 14665]
MGDPAGGVVVVDLRGCTAACFAHVHRCPSEEPRTRFRRAAASHPISTVTATSPTTIEAV